MHRYSNNIRCLRKKLNRHRQVKGAQEEGELVEEGEVEEEELLLEKIVSKYR